MKDIENSKLPPVQSALQRLDQAVARLESAAAKVEPAALSSASSKAATDTLERLSREHGALKATAGRVASRLDEAIGRLNASLQD